jgi:hypothetical protein
VDDGQLTVQVIRLNYNLSGRKRGIASDVRKHADLQFFLTEENQCSKIKLVPPKLDTALIWAGGVIVGHLCPLELIKAPSV